MKFFENVRCVGVIEECSEAGTELGNVRKGRFKLVLMCKERNIERERERKSEREKKRHRKKSKKWRKGRNTKRKTDKDWTRTRTKNKD